MSELLQQELDAISVLKKNMYICMTLSGSIKIESIFKKLTEIGATSFWGGVVKTQNLKNPGILKEVFMYVVFSFPR